MNDAPPRLRGTPLLLARVAALTISVGVAGILMVRAGAGCRSAETSVVAEPRSAAPVTAATAPAAEAPSAGEPQYFPGSKAWGGEIVAPSRPSAQPARSAAPASKPRYFEGSKSGLHIAEPAEDGR